MLPELHLAGFWARRYPGNMVMVWFLREDGRFVFVQRISPQSSTSTMGAVPFDSVLRLTDEGRGLELDSVRDHGLDW